MDTVDSMCDANASVGEVLDWLASRADFMFRSNILPFWVTHLFDPEVQRFFGYVDKEGNGDPDRPVSAILLCRMLWAFSVGFEETQGDLCLQQARNAFQMLCRDFIDPLFGGVYYTVRHLDGQPLVLQKRTFAQAFCIIACARYARVAADERAMREARRLFYHMHRSAGLDQGGFTDILQRDWSDDREEHVWWMNPQGCACIFNSQLHMLEAGIELEQAGPSAEVRRLLGIQLDFLFDWFVLPEADRSGGIGHLGICMSARKVPLDMSESIGNELEAAYLIRRAAELCAYPVDVSPFCATLVRNALELGIDKEHGGVFFSCDLSSNVVNRCKVWWVQAEAVVALLDAYEITGDSSFVMQAAGIWRFIETWLVDWQHGEWRSSAPNPYTDPLSVAQQAQRDRRTGTGKASAYKCPYHTVRVCVEVLNRVARLRGNPSSCQAQN